MRRQAGNGFAGEIMSCQDDDVAQDTGRYTGDDAGKRIADVHMLGRRIDRGCIERVDVWGRCGMQAGVWVERKMEEQEEDVGGEDPRQPIAVAL